MYFLRRSCLYGAVLDKPKNIPAAKPGKGAAQQTISKARVRKKFRNFKVDIHNKNRL